MILGFLAQEFHFQPSELFDMTVWDLEFWMKRQAEMVARLKK